MRTMKRVAAVAMSIVVLMTSGVTAKAAVTSVQPAKDASEVKINYQKKIGEVAPEDGWMTGINNNLSEIVISGNYIYAADDSKHCLKKIDKKTGVLKISKPYIHQSYTINYGAQICVADQKVFVGYENGMVQAFDQNTLKSLWVSEPITQETDGSGAISSLTYDKGCLYVATGTYVGGGNYGKLTTKDEDTTKTDEIKKFEWKKTSDGSYYYNKGGVVIGNYIIMADGKGVVKAYDKSNGSVKEEKGTLSLDSGFSGGIAYDQSKNMIYIASKSTMLYGIKVNNDGTFGTVKKIKIHDGGYIASAPEVYNGKVYISGRVDSEDYYAKGFMAVVDVSSSNYKVNYEVTLDAYSQCKPVIVQNGKDAVRVYFTENITPGGIYMIEDSKGAKTGKVTTIYEPSESDQQQYCGEELHVDNDGTIYYTNESRYLFAIGKKAVKSTPTVKPITKTQTSTKTVKLTWKKNKSAKGYVIYVKAGKGSYKKLTTVGKTTKKTVKVKAGTTYKFKVKPYKYTTKKGKKVKKYYKTYAAKIKSQSKTEKVVYKNVTGYTSYRIDMKVGNGSYKKMWTSKKKSTSTVTTLTYTYKNAKIGKSYKFRLVGIKKVNGKNTYKTLK